MRKQAPVKKHEADFEPVLHLIEAARLRAFSKVNTELIMLYYEVGANVSQKVNDGIWGAGTVDELAAYIADNLPGLKGFNRRGLYRMKQFFETYCAGSACYELWMDTQAPKTLPAPGQLKGAKGKNTVVSPPATQLERNGYAASKVSPPATQINEPATNGLVSALLTQIPWTSHLEILSGTKTVEEKLFYVFTAINEKWSKLELRRQLKAAYYERTMLGNKIPTSPVHDRRELQNIFKDPYIFDFLDLPQQHSEHDLEKALVQNLQKFILEIGKGFTYMGAQFRLQVGNKDYYSDLLFYHRDLQCLVLFELKIEDFQPEFLGKINFYLEALDRDVKRSHEKPSIGILLCKGKDTEVVKYAMARNISPAMIAEYETKLISKEALTHKLHELASQLAH